MTKRPDTVHGTNSADISVFARLSGARCTFPDFLALLTPERRAVIEQSVLDGTPKAVIFRAMREWSGAEVGMSVIQRHVSGECRCAR